MTRFLKLFAAAWGLAAVAQAQYTNILENTSTQFVESVWSTDTIVVGATTKYNALGIYDGGHVTNTTSTVGKGSGADDNIVNVSGDASWIMSGDLIVGDEGSGNYFEIDDGATVSNADSYVGISGTSTGNIVVVTDEGSVWNNAGTIHIGSGTSNQVAVYSGGTITAQALDIAGSDGGFYLSYEGTLRINNDFDAGMDGFNWYSGGLLEVTGELSGTETTNGFSYLNKGRGLTIDSGTWTTSNKLVVGYSSSADLTVENGGWVNVGEATTNLAAGGIIVASTNGAELVVDNSATVEAPGLYLGQGAATGSATVTNGGFVTLDELVIESGNAFNLGDNGTLSMTGNFDVDAQTNLYWTDGGSLAVGGTLSKSNGLDGTERTLTLNGGDWMLGDTAVVSGISNTLNVVDGGSLATVSGTVSGTNNDVVVEDSGSEWSNTGTLTVTGTNNAVTVQDSGRIETDALDVQDGNNFNLEDGGTLAMTGDFDVGSHSNLNWNAGGNLSVGGNLTGMEGSYLNGEQDLTLNGINARWANGTNSLIIGKSADNSDLVVTNGAKVSSGYGYIGWGSGAEDNSVLVTGSGSAWTNRSGGLYVGVYGDDLSLGGGGNTLAVRDGAWVFVGEATTNAAGGGLLVASTNGAELVVGNGSVTVEDTLYLGLDAATTGTNIIKGGGWVTVDGLQIADGSYLDLRENGTFAITSDFDLAAYSTNQFNWNEGAQLSVGGTLTGLSATNLVVGGTTNTYSYLGGSRDLILDGTNASYTTANLLVGLDGDGSEILLQDGAALNSQNTIIGWDSDDNVINVQSGSSYINTGDLTIGYSDDNSLLISDAGTVTIGQDLRIGTDGTSGNYAYATGTNSTLNVGGNLNIGTGSDEGSNLLVVDDGASALIGGDLTLYASNGLAIYDESIVEIGGDMYVYDYSEISGSGTNLFTATGATLSLTGTNYYIDDDIVFKATGAGSLVSVNDGQFFVDGSVSNQYFGFEKITLTDSLLFGSGIIDAGTFGTLEMTGGTISPRGGVSYPYGTLEISSDVSFSGTRYLAQGNLIDGDMENDLLILSGTNSVDLGGLDLDLQVLDSIVDTEIPILIATNGGFGGTTFNSTNVVDYMLLFDTELIFDSTGIVSMVTTANGEEFSSALDYAGSEGVRAGYGAMKNSVFARTKQLRRNQVATAHAIPNEAYLMSQTNAPAGAMGPGDQNTIFDMNVWVQYFNGQGSYDPQGNSYGFDLNNNGTTIGFDRLFGEDLTLGLNYTYARSSADTTNSDSIDTETYWLGAYGEWVSKNGLYVDALAAAGYSSYDSIRFEENYEGIAAYNGTSMGAYCDVGQYYYYKNLALSPYVGLHMLYTKANSHTETETTSESETTVHDFERTWLESAIGLKARYRFDTALGRFQLTGYGEWTHDFLNQDVYSTLSAGEMPAVDMAKISPDANLINTGVGISLICTDYLEVGVGYNGRFSDDYKENSGTLMLNVMF
jgi:outer membrane autotransporter protein